MAELLRALPTGPAVSRKMPSWPWAVVLSLIVVAGFAAPWLSPYDPIEQIDTAAGQLRPPLTSLAAIELDHGRWLLADTVERKADGLYLTRLGRTEVLPIEQVRNLTASGVADRRFFLLGSDRFSRDILSRLLYGARVSLFVGSAVILLSLTIGLLVGATAALSPSWVDTLLMRFVDGLLAFPSLILLLALSAALPSSIWTLVLVIASVGWMGLSRLVRAEILSLQNRDFVHAARTMGASTPRILWRHLMPNVMTPILVDVTLRISRVIMVESSLSFLGLGIQAPLASWGNMISDGRGEMFSSWWVAGFPCLALVLTVISLSILSDHFSERQLGSQR